MAGLTRMMAQNVVAGAMGNGQFKNRQQLLKVSRSGRSFRAVRGFLHINHGDNPLDALPFTRKHLSGGGTHW
ncbi:hypothetical protein ACNKHV_21375 [Shigella flexneri]